MHKVSHALTMEYDGIVAPQCFLYGTLEILYAMMEPFCHYSEQGMMKQFPLYETNVQF